MLRCAFLQSSKQLVGALAVFVPMPARAYAKLIALHNSPLAGFKCHAVAQLLDHEEKLSTRIAMLRDRSDPWERVESAI